MQGWEDTERADDDDTMPPGVEMRRNYEAGDGYSVPVSTYTFAYLPRVEVVGVQTYVYNGDGRATPQYRRWPTEGLARGYAEGVVEAWLRAVEGA